MAVDPIDRSLAEKLLAEVTPISSKVTLSWLDRIVRLLKKGWKGFAQPDRRRVGDAVDILRALALRGESPQTRQKATATLLRMVLQLQKREQTSTPEEKSDIISALMYAKMNMQQIFKTLKEEGAELGKKYGAVLGKGILAKATSQQGALDMCSKQVIQLQDGGGDTDTIKKITSAMVQQIGKKYGRAFVQEFSSIESLVVLGAGPGDENVKLFIEKAKENPWAGFMALDQIEKISPEAFRELQARLQTGAWPAGKIFLEVRKLGKATLSTTAQNVYEDCLQALTKPDHNEFLTRVTQDPAMSQGVAIRLLFDLYASETPVAFPIVESLVKKAGIAPGDLALIYAVRGVNDEMVRQLICMSAEKDQLKLMEDVKSLMKIREEAPAYLRAFEKEVLEGSAEPDPVTIAKLFEKALVKQSRMAKRGVGKGAHPAAPLGGPHGLSSSALKRAKDLVHSMITELSALLALATIFPLDLEKFDPKVGSKDIDPTQTPILMIHGFLGSSNNWLYHRNYLRGEYKNIFTINLGNPLDSIDTYAKKVRDKVEEIKTITGRPDIAIVAHSMGGLVARQYRYHYAKGVDVKKIVTLGTPLQGTKAAYLASWVSASAREMEPNSPFVTELQKQASVDSTTMYHHIGSTVDMIIRPRFSATAGHSQKQKTERVFNVGHINYLFSPTVAAKVKDALGNLKDADPAIGGS